MSDSRSVPNESHPQDAAWADLFRGGRGLYSLLIIMGTLLHSLQTLVIAIIMPTVVADIGGAEYYTWASMLYTIGVIVGAAAVGPVWRLLRGARRGYAASGVVFLLGTLGCAFAPDMLMLNVARTVQGLAGGLVSGGSMALVSGLFTSGLRRRILAIHQATFTTSHLLGPLVGGVFASIGWWRGSFWVLAPFAVLFAVLAWLRIPDHLGNEPLKDESSRMPVIRLTLLTSGVFCVAMVGLVKGIAMRSTLIAIAVALLWLNFRIDRVSTNRLYPSSALSLHSPVGLSLWILFLVGSVQVTVPLFLPLLLQVVHGITPIFISFLTIVISSGWTASTFFVSGWAGKRERFALRVGPLLMIAGLGAMTLSAQNQNLMILTLAAFIYGIGLGFHNVHLVARVMAAAIPGEERETASSVSSIRSLGMAFGAALAGMLSTIAGLGTATEPHAVGAAVTFVYRCNLIPLVIASLLMMRLVFIGKEKAGRPIPPHQ